jgi:UDP-N-acetylenolpyruvoylglucosamine reductase
MASRRFLSSLAQRTAITRRHQRWSPSRILPATSSASQEEVSATGSSSLLQGAAALAVAAAATVSTSYWQNRCATVHLEGSITDAAAASDDTTTEKLETTTQLLNWSGTHAVHTKHFWEPESIAEVERIVSECQSTRQPVRPVGSALSPNGIAFHEGGMIGMANLDQIVQIDKAAMRVTVQAGARVSQVVEALRRHKLTLPNLASIAEQQMGGFVQVGAHGTGRCIAPVDHYVRKLKLVTPALGTIVLTEEADAEIFHMAKVGLGCLGVVVEVTMDVIPAHKLREHTFVLTRKQAKQQLDALLKEHKHMRYMWIPYTDAVVCVTNDPEKESFFGKKPKGRAHSTAERLAPLVNLLLEVTANQPHPATRESVEGMGFGELRDALLAVNPLDIDHVKKCNAAEAEFWKLSEGYVVKPSDELLQFDCGGQVRARKALRNGGCTKVPSFLLYLYSSSKAFPVLITAIGLGSLLSNWNSGREQWQRHAFYGTTVGWNRSELHSRAFAY